MADEAVLAKLNELTEAINLWNVGMREVMDSLALQATMLEDILKAMTVEAPEESPLAQLLSQLVASSDMHTNQLAVILASLDRLDQRLSG